MFRSNIHQTQAELDPLNQRIVGGMLDDDESERFEDWSPEKQRAAYEGMLRTDAKLSTRRDNADEFLALHPEFVDSESNGEAMKRILDSLYGDVPFTLAMYQKAFEVGCANGNFQLNQAEIKRQEKAAAEERAKSIREKHARQTRVYTEDEKNNMSLEELREAENREIRRQFELEGQRGGLGL